MKQKSTTATLFISAVLLGAFIWYVERGSETTYEKQQQRITLFDVRPQSIHRIEMTRGDVLIECSKASGEWRLSKPTDAPVSRSVVQQMIAGMSAVERGELILSETLNERGLTPFDYGFDEPRARITFENNLGTFTWLIGRDTPLGDMLYVMSEQSGDIITAPKTLLNLVPEDPAWIRDRSLFKTTAGGVRRIDLQRAAGFLQLSQTEDNDWVMQQPHEGPADNLSVNTLIDKILSAQIGKFIVDEQTDLTIYGLEDAALELTLFGENEKTQTLLIGKSLPGEQQMRYAKWIDNDSVFTVPSKWAKEFELTADSLRKRTLMDEQPHRISRLTVTSGESQTELVRTNEQWNVMRPARWDAEQEAVDLLLDALANSVILEFVDTPNNNQIAIVDNAPWSVTFGTDEQQQTLHISDPIEEGLLMVRRNEEPSFNIIAGGTFEDAFRNPLFYRSRAVLEIDPAQIKSLTLTAADNEFRVEHSEGQYTATDRDQQPDDDALADLTSELTALRAERYIAFNPESLQPYGLETPQARLSIALHGTNILGRVLLLGNTAEDGRYAMMQGQPVVFVLPEHSAKALTQELTHPFEKQTEEITQP